MNNTCPDSVVEQIIKDLDVSNVDSWKTNYDGSHRYLKFRDSYSLRKAALEDGGETEFVELYLVKLTREQQYKLWIAMKNMVSAIHDRSQILQQQDHFRRLKNLFPSCFKQ